MIGVIISLVLGIMLSLMWGLIFIINNSTCKSERIIGMFLIFLAGILTSFLLIIIFPEPSAIDVYRNKTTLEITETVRDSVVIDRDSVVVWKKKIK